MKVQQKKERYKTLKSYPGIRKELASGKYVVGIYSNKKRLSQSFDKLDLALQWQMSFKRDSILGFLKEEDDREMKTEKVNTFKVIWERYKTEHLPSLEKSSQENRLLLAKFFVGMFDTELNQITPSLISKYILQKKEVALKSRSHRRKNFNQELKLLSAIFNWYKDEIDHTFSNPVIKKHKTLGVISKEPPRNKKMNLAEIKLFLDALKERPFWYDFALTQLLCAGRVQEIAGLQKKNVDFKSKRLIIKEVVVWSKQTKRFDHLKPIPKNGETREVFLCEQLSEVLEKRILGTISHSNYVFHEHGEPVSYRQIQYNYEWALIQAGLSDLFSGTHFLRHSMATLTRLVTGSLNSTQAVTGHKDFRLVQHYGEIDRDENRKAITAVEKHLTESNFF